MKTVLVLLALLVAVLQYDLWFAEGGLLSAIRLNHRIQLERQVQQQLQKQNQALSTEIKGLRNNNETVVRHARYDLGMIKQGEVFYQLEKARK